MLRDRLPHVPVLILSMHDEDTYAERALRAGAKGYVMKQESPETILTAIRHVLQGQVHVSERVGSRLLSQLTCVEGSEEKPSIVKQLSNRELEIFDLVGRGLTTRQIASRLRIGTKTVESHRAGIKLKLKLKTSTELTHRATQWVENENGGC
jgi:DNA-binding NarL/FixJ family response regulator